jgi:hypothetical protein
MIRRKKAICDVLHALSSNLARVLAGGAGAARSMFEHLLARLSERGVRVSR